eukprot:3936461-Rhodomonas_salina.1
MSHLGSVRAAAPRAYFCTARGPAPNRTHAHSPTHVSVAHKHRRREQPVCDDNPACVVSHRTAARLSHRDQQRLQLDGRARPGSHRKPRGRQLGETARDQHGCAQQHMHGGHGSGLFHCLRKHAVQLRPGTRRHH